MAREDIYLVKKEPIRGKKLVESNRKANLHVLAEFALQVIVNFPFYIYCFILISFSLF